VNTYNATFTIPNSGTDLMFFHNAVTRSEPAFLGSAKTTWADPTAGLHPTLDLITLVWGGSQTDNFSGTTSPTTRNVPAGYLAAPAGVAAGGSFTLRVSFRYKTKNEPLLTQTPLQKLCLAYRITSEPSTTKFCNVVGQSVTTNNPNACD
jgi:hypothetical protein